MPPGRFRERPEAWNLSRDARWSHLPQAGLRAPGGWQGCQHPCPRGWLCHSPVRPVVPGLSPSRHEQPRCVDSSRFVWPRPRLTFSPTARSSPAHNHCSWLLPSTGQRRMTGGPEASGHACGFRRSRRCALPPPMTVKPRMAPSPNMALVDSSQSSKGRVQEPTQAGRCPAPRTLGARGTRLTPQAG